MENLREAEDHRFLLTKRPPYSVELTEARSYVYKARVVAGPPDIYLDMVIDTGSRLTWLPS